MQFIQVRAILRDGPMHKVVERTRAVPEVNSLHGDPAPFHAIEREIVIRRFFADVAEAMIEYGYEGFSLENIHTIEWETRPWEEVKEEQEAKRNPLGP